MQARSSEFAGRYRRKIDARPRSAGPAQAFIGLELAHVLAQRFRRNSESAYDMRDRAAGFKDRPGVALKQIAEGVTSSDRASA